MLCRFSEQDSLHADLLLMLSLISETIWVLHQCLHILCWRLITGYDSDRQVKLKSFNLGARIGLGEIPGLTDCFSTTDFPVSKGKFHFRYVLINLTYSKTRTLYLSQSKSNCSVNILKANVKGFSPALAYAWNYSSYFQGWNIVQWYWGWRDAAETLLLWWCIFIALLQSAWFTFYFKSVTGRVVMGHLAYY